MAEVEQLYNYVDFPGFLLAFKDVTGHEARSFKQFATDFAPAFGASKVPAAHA